MGFSAAVGKQMSARPNQNGAADLESTCKGGFVFKNSHLVIIVALLDKHICNQ